MKAVDRVFGWLLFVASLLHCAGSFAVYKTKPDLFLWAEGAGLAGLLLAGLNILRVGRPDDRALAWVSSAGCPGAPGGSGRVQTPNWNFFDFRPLTHAIITLVLAAFSLRTALGRASQKGNTR